MWQTVPDAYRGAEILPVEEVKYRGNAQFIKWDVLSAVSGQTKPHVLGNDVARVEVPKLATYVERTTHYRERITLNEEDLMNLRNVGAAERTRMAGGIVVRAMTTLRIRLAVRKENLRWDAIRGSIVLNENGVKRTITYGVAAPQTVSTRWDDREMSNPINDIQDAILRFRGTGGGMPELWMTFYVATLLSQNVKVQRLLRGTGFIGQIGPTQIVQLLPALIGLDRINVYDIHWTPQNANGTAGDPQPFLSDEQVHLIAKSMMPGERLGEFASTPSIFNGGYENPKGGDYFFFDNNTDKPNPYLDVIAGCDGIPVLFHPEWIQNINVVDLDNLWVPNS
jgi:hypothetical protein